MLVDRATVAALLGTLESRIKVGSVRGIKLSVCLAESDDTGQPLTYEVDFAWSAADQSALSAMPLLPAAGAPHFRVAATFKARYPRSCTIDSSHRISKGDEVGRLVRTDNPMLEGLWVACTACTKELK